MHRRLKKLLHAAEGKSQFVVAVFLDVRGFSAWMTDSSKSAVYLKSIYTKILDDYFAEADFFKPTGDGLLVVLDHDEASLESTVQAAVSRGISLVEDFVTLTDGDRMVNFDVPTKLGVGVARGSATRLISGRETLDYSGEPLNLAARLMDLARPSGVVFDASLGIELLDKGTAARFVEEEVYVKGISEDAPMSVYALRDRVVIPEFNRFPIGRFRQHATKPERASFKALQERDRFLHALDVDPAARDQIQVFLQFPKPLPNGRRHPTMLRSWDFPAVFVERRGAKYARVDYQAILPTLEQEGVKANWTGEVWLEYPVRDSGA